ncbi:MAG: M28 family peptidase [Oscillospiraceae bacterium]|nr:M28 family peptidase [Oscillospiraceae bacterium]
MTQLSQAILDRFQVRKTQKQKDAFITLLKEHFPELSIQKGGFAKSRNLILGDVSQAKIVLSAHYDTCAKLPFPNFIAPKNLLLSILYSILIALPVVAVMFIISYLLNWLTQNFWVNYGVCVGICLVMIYLMLAGPANNHTANDNTSGVIALCELYSALTAEERTKVAAVFFDNEELGLLGSALFRKQYRKEIKDKLLINLDCVSDGDHFLVAVNKAARQHYYVQIKNAFTSTDEKQILLEKAERVYYPSDQANFPMSIAVAALKHKKLLGYYMDRIHTKRDIIFDEKNISFLTNALHKLIQLL